MAEMKPACEIMRDHIKIDVIPELIKLGRTELVAKLEEAIEVGEDKYGEFASYWEGIRIFADNGLRLAKQSEVYKNGK